MTEPIKKNDHVEFRDAFDVWHRGVAASGVEPTHMDGKKVHDFPVVWVVKFGKRGLVRVPWPAEDVRHAPPGVPDDFEEIERLRKELSRGRCLSGRESTEATVADTTERGLYEKYRVERTDGKGVGRCIVLELDDRNSWPALLTWAETVEAEGYVALAADVRAWVLQAEKLANLPDSYEGWQR